MGAKASKPAQSATRKFPTRGPGSAVPPPPPSSKAAAAAASQARTTGAKASFTKDDAIRADGRNPDPNPLQDQAFSSRLRKMGVATPNPTFSNSSTFNPNSPPPSSSSPSHQQQPSSNPRYPAASSNATLGALEARRQIQERAQVETENPGSPREFVDAGTLRQVLNLRIRGAPAAEIERRLRLKSGVVERLGRPGVIVPLAGS
ncbi:hypothetical protein MGN70_006496 [Eutypa lata]|nr:hypothetical protein MGN70_006496 [Eutypa lata]